MSDRIKNYRYVGKILFWFHLKTLFGTIFNWWNFKYSGTYKMGIKIWSKYLLNDIKKSIFCKRGVHKVQPHTNFLRVWYPGTPQEIRLNYLFCFYCFERIALDETNA